MTELAGGLIKKLRDVIWRAGFSGEIDAKGEEQLAMLGQGYSDMDVMEYWAREQLSGQNMKMTKYSIKGCYLGTHFSHIEAYMLCAVGRTWPEFVFHPENRNYVLNFDNLNSTTDKTDRHEDFRTYVVRNKEEISRAAAEALDIAWNEIEGL